MNKKEREVFGVTYDRYVLLNLHPILADSLNLKKVVEMPSHGAKAAGSLYSLGFGKAGCNVTLVNPEIEMLKGWDETGLSDKVDYVIEKDIYHTCFEDNSFDLAWNFVTWTELEDKKKYIEEMKRISNKYILLVTCNNFQPGYPWHRFLHNWYGFPWTHGDVEYNHITRVKKLLKESDLKIKEYGAIDTPGWPDPSGPRDVRLHRRYSNNTELEKIDNKKKPDWEVPIVEYLKNDSYPGWMKKLGKWDMLFRKGVFKLPLSHLFYVIAEK
ncbi:MAG: methyltransferase domain-containing protein [Candidatus Muiribacteriota bacterium]